MKVEITYPPVSRRKFQRKKLLEIVRWPCLAAAVACPAVNLITGGRAWSVVALMALYMLWTLVLSPSLVEYNRISQVIRLIACSCILLGLIDWLLAPGWVLTVIPIVCFGGLAVAGTLFYTDLERQKRNMGPMLFLILASIAGSALGLTLWREAWRWTLWVMGALAVALLIACAATLGSDFRRELKRRFHVK